MTDPNQAKEEADSSASRRNDKPEGCGMTDQEAGSVYFSTTSIVED